MSELLGQGAYDRIRSKLLAGDLPPGTRLVNRKLAQEVGMSTIPVREAIGRLVSEGLIEYVPGAGAFVRHPDPGELEQLYSVREALEPMAAEAAARHATDFELQQLRAVCDDWKALAGELRATKSTKASRRQMDRWVDNEERFHGILLSAARNRWLSKVSGELRLLARVFTAHRSGAASLVPRIATKVWRQHVALLEAVSAHDADGARRLMTEHIQIGRRFAADHLSRA